jgi:uncharacterized protein
MKMEEKIIYFAEPGSNNTDEVLRIVRARAQALNIKKIVVASTTGETAVKAMKALQGFNVIVMSHYTGCVEPNVQEFREENKRIVENSGGTVFTTTHVFAGLGRAMTKKFGTYLFEEMVANTLRVFGHGMKVACEIAIMAADAGLVRTDEDIITVGGSSSGADTALLLQPVNSPDFFDLRVKEILCKPRF